MKISNNPENTLYIYCRVSTSGQEKDGTSLEVQKERGIELSKKLKLTPIVILEQGSGLKPYVEVRPKFVELMDEIEEGRIRNVWVDEDTRLTRYDIDQQFIHLQMKKKGVSLFVGSSIEPKKWDWVTDLVDTLMTKVNQHQINTQVRKSIRSKRKLFEEGFYMKGDPPFGYKLENKKLVPNEETKVWVERIFRDYDDGKTTPQIQKLLFENSVYPPRNKITGNDTFPLETIVNILKNRNYIGVDVYGDLMNSCPPLVDRRIFDSVQKKVSDKKGSKEVVKHDGLLKGLLKCPDGKMMTVLGVKKNRIHPLYTCGHRERKYKSRGTNDCKIKKSLRVELMDEYIWNLFIDTLKDSKTIREKTKRELVGNKSKNSIQSINRRVKRLQKDLDSLNEKRSELNTKYYTNELKKDSYNKLCDSISNKENELTTQIQVNQSEIDRIRSGENWIDWLGKHLQGWESMRNLNDLSEKKKILKDYIHEIIVSDYNDDTKEHSLSIRFRIPIVNDKLQFKTTKNGEISRDKKGLRKYSIEEGSDNLNNPFTHLKSLHRY